MIMFLVDVAEWCVEALVLSLAFFFGALGTLILMFICAITWRTIKRIDLTFEDVKIAVSQWWGRLNGKK
tara:strand:- start:6369 stop:6575 length:207 start_codon:yes stop_codon:yes gene_type:complete